jgi:hypothetical protein
MKHFGKSVAIAGVVALSFPSAAHAITWTTFVNAAALPAPYTLYSSFSASTKGTQMTSCSGGTWGKYMDIATGSGDVLHSLSGPSCGSVSVGHVDTNAYNRCGRTSSSGGTDFATCKKGL